MSDLPVAIPKGFLKEFCERNHIRKLSLFGSVLTPTRFRPDSDLDVLVEFDAGHVPGSRHIGRNGIGFKAIEDTVSIA